MGGWKREGWGGRQDLDGRVQSERTALRQSAERVCSRLDWLDKPDRILLEMVYEQGLSIRKIAAVLRQNPSTVARRLRLLVDGLFSPEYQICLLCRRQLSPLQMSIARQFFVQKKSRRWMAEFHHLTLYALRRQLDQLSVLIEEHKHLGMSDAGTAAHAGAEGWCG